jgi:hypothetical protein
LIRLDPETRSELESWLRASTTEQRMARRARVILLAAAGKGSRAIAREIGVRPRVVSTWRMRFAARGIEGLKDKPRPDAEAEDRSGRAQKPVREQRSRFRSQGRRYRWALHGPGDAEFYLGFRYVAYDRLRPIPSRPDTVAHCPPWMPHHFTGVHRASLHKLHWCRYLNRRTFELEAEKARLLIAIATRWPILNSKGPSGPVPSDARGAYDGTQFCYRGQSEKQARSSLPRLALDSGALGGHNRCYNRHFNADKDDHLGGYCRRGERAAGAFMAESPYPILNPRARGWLRHLWDKATTADDWSPRGEPHPWWDRVSTEPMCSFPRFDLSESTYALIMMADQTPAWREVYTRIADELCLRHTTYWAAIDWLTQIGHDPRRKNYPEEWCALIPRHLWGEYDVPGWTANGTDPWGLQPDPIGSDGNLFFRGFFNLVLSTYRYISGNEKWERPFKVVGYQEKSFEWTQTRIVDFIKDQWERKPEGPHCENTKVWPYCLSAAGLGLQLYDNITGKRAHVVYESWLEYARRHYVSVSSKGKLERFTLYYDPLLKHHHMAGPVSALGTCFYMLPQNREFAQFIYEAAVNTIGWSDPRSAVRKLPEPRLMLLAIVLAREFGDYTTQARLVSVAEKHFQPLFFGVDAERFGWWFNLGEAYPRGQLSSLMMVTEVGTSGDWARAFSRSHDDRFNAPTVEGVDYPKLGISQAWNDAANGVLNVTTYAPTLSLRGTSAPWRVANLRDASDAVVICDGELFHRTHVTEDGELEIGATVGDFAYHIHTGYRALTHATNATTEGQASDWAALTARPSAAVDYFGPHSVAVLPAATTTCPCCPV